MHQLRKPGGPRGPLPDGNADFYASLQGPPAQHVGGGASGALRSSLSACSELLYPSEDTLRRSLDASRAHEEVAIAAANQRVEAASRMGVAPPLPVVLETDESNSRGASMRFSQGAGGRPRTAESDRPLSAGYRPGSAPEVPSLDLSEMPPPGTPRCCY